MSLTLGLGLVAAALGQGPPLNEADNPIDLNGVYMCPGASGYARANTNPTDRLTFNQVVEMSGGVLAKDGTFTPYNDITKWPARMQVDLTNKAYEFEIDLAAGTPGVDWKNAVFAIGAGSEIGSSASAGAQLEITKSLTGYQFDWRSGTGSTNSIVNVVPASPLPTKFRIRVEFNGGGFAPTLATVTITPMNNVPIPIDTVVQNLPVNVSVTNTSFVAGFQAPARENQLTSKGYAVVQDFVTNAGPNAMWMIDQGAYKSTNQAASQAAQTPIEYCLGMSNPTERVYAWQALIDPIFFYVGTDFSVGAPVFNMPMLAPFDGTLDNPFPPYPGLPRGIIRAGAYSINGTPSGSEQSNCLATLTFAILDGEMFQRPVFVATDPAGGPAPAVTTLQGSGYTTIASGPREASGVLVDNTRPFTSQLRVIQDSVNNPAILHQGPVTIRFRAEDFGLPFQFNMGSGLAQYPRAVLRPIANTSIAAGVQTGDYDITSEIYPLNDNLFEANLTIGTPGTLNVTCGLYRVITWAEDRVGLVSIPATTGNQGFGYDGVSSTFEVRKFNSLAVTVSLPGFVGGPFDPIHQSPPRVQRWVTLTVGGPTTGSGSTPPKTYEKFILLDPAGNGTVTLSAADGLPCPGPNMWVSVKDQQHSLRTTIPMNLTPNTSDYTATLSLKLGDLNNDNRVGIADFGIFLFNYGIIYTQNDITYAGFTSHCDMSGNKRVGVEDYMFIQNNNNAMGNNLPGSFTPAGSVDTDKIQVSKLLSMGVTEAKRYDFNGDGWVTTAEMQKVLQLKNAHKW